MKEQAPQARIWENKKRIESFYSRTEYVKEYGRKWFQGKYTAVHGVLNSLALRHALFGYDPVIGTAVIPGAEVRTISKNDLPKDSVFNQDQKFIGIEGIRLLNPEDPRYEGSSVNCPLLYLTDKQTQVLEIFNGIRTEDQELDKSSIFKKTGFDVYTPTNEELQDWFPKLHLELVLHVVDENRFMWHDQRTGKDYHGKIGVRNPVRGIKHETPRPPEDLIPYAQFLHDKFLK